ncbi:TetR/AcrR family transcriptional regulator [Halobacillus litoralis]|uniref:TetR/AcrR family transcriptional regulator n=1 Tax=Halobacillus litoralis TaxID=45668 RepID=UPI001CFD22D1|nr:TetR/AcrR family transcriptional regulator [Halobacillus litoralis]
MKETITDLRVLRTKESIRDALVELMEEKGFEAIKVKDITTRAKINRGTFYSHYQDKYDLMNKCEEEIMKELAGLVLKNVPNIIASPQEDTSSATTPFSVLVSIFKYLDQNRRFMKAVLGPKGDVSFQAKLKKFVWKTIFESNNHPIIKKENLLVPGEFLVSYVASAHIGVIQQWLNSEREESPEEMAHILINLTINGPFYAAGLKK